jgi:hypothetical protein
MGGLMRRFESAGEQIRPGCDYRRLRVAGRRLGPRFGLFGSASPTMRTSSSSGSNLGARRRLERGEPEDDVRHALARPAHGAEFVRHGDVNPDRDLALGVGLSLKSDAAQRQRIGDRVESGGCDGDADQFALIEPSRRSRDARQPFVALPALSPSFFLSRGLGH